MDASGGRLTAEVRGEIEKDEQGVLVIRRIHVTYRLRVDPEAREDVEAVVERVHEMHASRCPVARSIAGAIDVTTEIELVR